MKEPTDAIRRIGGGAGMPPERYNAFLDAEQRDTIDRAKEEKANREHERNAACVSQNVMQAAIDQGWTIVKVKHESHPFGKVFRGSSELRTQDEKGRPLGVPHVLFLRPVTVDSQWEIVIWPSVEDTRLTWRDIDGLEAGGVRIRFKNGKVYPVQRIGRTSLSQAETLVNLQELKATEKGETKDADLHARVAKLEATKGSAERLAADNGEKLRLFVMKYLQTLTQTEVAIFVAWCNDGMSHDAIVEELRRRQLPSRTKQDVGRAIEKIRKLAHENGCDLQKGMGRVELPPRVVGFVKPNDDEPAEVVEACVDTPLETAARNEEQSIIQRWEEGKLTDDDKRQYQNELGEPFMRELKRRGLDPV